MSVENKKHLGKNVANARMRIKMTQKDLALAVGVSIRHIQEIEYGRTDIKLSILEKIAVKLGLEPFQLLILNNGAGSEVAREICPLKFPNISCPADAIEVPIQIFDASGTIVFSTAKSSLYLGYSMSEICFKKKIWDFLADEEEQLSLKSYLAHLLEHKIRPLPISTTTLRKDGVKVPVLMDWSYIKDDQQGIAGFLSVLSPR